MELSIPNIHSPIAFTTLRRSNLPSKYERFPNSPNPQFVKRLHLITLFSRKERSNSLRNSSTAHNAKGNRWKSGIQNPVSPPLFSTWTSRFRIRDHTFLFLAVIASMTSMAFISLVVAAVPTLFAMRRAAISFAKLIDTAHLELPNTMAAIRLSSMELSDLTLELNDLKQDISEGVTNSAPPVEASETGTTQIGSIAYRQTIRMVKHERANIPCISMQSVRFGAYMKNKPKAVDGDQGNHLSCTGWSEYIIRIEHPKYIPEV